MNIGKDRKNNDKLPSRVAFDRGYRGIKELRAINTSFLITPDGWSSLVLLSKTTPWDEGKIGDLFPLSIHGE